MKTIMQAIDAYLPMKPGDAVVVGLSGGADSVMLTHYLHRFGARVFAVHVNHGLRGEESDAEERFVLAFCEELSIPCAVYRIDAKEEAARLHMSVEEAGRKLRYDFFAKEAAKHEAVIATAHTMSDQAETVLFRLARGAGTKGLCGIPYLRKEEGMPDIIRPLLYISRDDVEAYCKANGLQYVTDSSNLADAYARNKIRHHVMPVLTQINDRAVLHIGQAAKSLEQDDDYLSGQAAAAYAGCVKEGRLDAKAYLCCHPAMQKRVAALFLAGFDIAADRAMLERFHVLAERVERADMDKRYGEISLPDEKVCFLRAGFLSVCGIAPGKDFPGKIDITKRKVYRMPSGKTYTFEIVNQSEIKDFQNVHKNLFYMSLDYDTIKGVLICRGRLSGETIQIAGRNVSKTVKKWMNEQKIPPHERDKRFVLADENGILAIEGMGIAARAAVQDRTERLLVITELSSAEISADGIT